MVKITIKKKTLKKILLLLIGIFLFILILEMGLRIAGFWIYSKQRAGYEISDIVGSEYRILALGESTTADLQNGQGSWPEELEIVLNKRNVNLQFKVFNEGIPGTTVSVILSNLEHNLEKYKPHMVIAMMGTNDPDLAVSCDIWKMSSFYRNLRVYKLGKFLLDTLRNKPSDNTLPFFQAAETEIPDLTDEGNLGGDVTEIKFTANTKAELDYITSGIMYYNEKNFSEAIEMLTKALEINPKNKQLYSFLVESYLQLNRFDEEVIKVAEQYNEHYGSVGAYVTLAKYSMDSGNFLFAEKVLKKGMEIDPENEGVFASLGRLYALQGQYPTKGEEMSKKALAINPNNLLALNDLGAHYGLLINNGTEIYKPEEAIALLKRYINLNPESWGFEYLLKIYVFLGRLEEAEEFLDEYINYQSAMSAYSYLASYYISHNNFDHAKGIFKKINEANPMYLWSVYKRIGEIYEKLDSKAAEVFYKEALKVGNEEVKKINETNTNSIFDLCMQMGKLYEKLGRSEEAEEMFEKTRIIQNEYFNPSVQENYKKLYKILNERGIKLVAMQYPTLSVEGLRIMLDDNKNIIFASNEENFKKALESVSYEELFVDHGVGSFGHATRRGNRLIAENVANVILKELGPMLK